MSNALKEQAHQLQSYLDSKKYKVKYSHCLEAVSHLQTGHCYNIGKQKDTDSRETVRILQANEFLSANELKHLDYHVDVVIPVPLDVFFSDLEYDKSVIDIVNEYASQTILHHDYALCDINYEVYPYIYNNGSIAIRVTGYVEDPELLASDDSSIINSTQTLDEFFQYIEGANIQVKSKDNDIYPCRVTYVDGETLGWWFEIHDFIQHGGAIEAYLKDNDYKYDEFDCIMFEFNWPGQSLEDSGTFVTLMNVLEGNVIDGWLVMNGISIKIA